MAAKRTTKKQAAPDLVTAIIEGLEDKKAKKIVKMDLRKSSGAIAEYFIIATGTSDTHLQALSDSVFDKVKEKINEKPVGIEGARKGDWVLMDYVNVIVHLFLKEKRAFYNIEDLWGDAGFEFIGSQD